MNVLENIENGAAHIANLKTQVLRAKKIQLHSGLEGFESPESFGVYKNTGGKALGVVGSTFEPCDLELFTESIYQSILKSGLDLDVSKIQYQEFFGGSKVSFDIPYKNYEIQSPMVGDTLKTKLNFKTGFDGKTKMSIGFYSYRIWCKNRAGNWTKDVELSMKNTKGNAEKVMFFVNEIIRAASMADNYVLGLNELVKKPIVQSDIDNFLTELTGYSVKDYTILKTKQRNILDRINERIAIETNNTGKNMFSLLQGITNYTTHVLAKGNEESILYATSAKMNADAHKLAFAMN